MSASSSQVANYSSYMDGPTRTWPSFIDIGKDVEVTVPALPRRWLIGATRIKRPSPTQVDHPFDKIGLGISCAMFATRVKVVSGLDRKRHSKDQTSGQKLGGQPLGAHIDRSTGKINEACGCARRQGGSTL